MNGILQLQRRWSRRTLVCVYGTVPCGNVRHEHCSAKVQAQGSQSWRSIWQRIFRQKRTRHTGPKDRSHYSARTYRGNSGQGVSWKTVMVNGQQAAVIWGDGEIKHFVGPLPDGVSEIAATVQDDMGGIKTQQISYHCHKKTTLPGYCVPRYKTRTSSINCLFECSL
jgi:hypothetical protein